MIGEDWKEHLFCVDCALSIIPTAIPVWRDPQDINGALIAQQPNFVDKFTSKETWT